MKLNNEEQFWSWYNVQESEYGKCIFHYSWRWALYMEYLMDNGYELEEIAEMTSFLADEEGITGFMYNCAVQTLNACWIYGDDLRRWHNLDVQLQDEGETTNLTGGMLNSATFNIGYE